MARYDESGYRSLPRIDSSPRRQILGYSRLAQGGVAQARERAARAVYDAQDHLYEGPGRYARAEARGRRVAEAAKAGTLDETQADYNEAAESMGSDARMDAAGSIARVRSYLGNGSTYGPTKVAPARSTPLNYQRPADQRVDDIVGMASPSGLLDMARKARRRGTLVVK